MQPHPASRLQHHRSYLQIALNHTLDDARQIIAALPQSDRLILEVGTPLIKHYGTDAIRQIHMWYSRKLAGQPLVDLTAKSVGGLMGIIAAWQAVAATTRNTAQQTSTAPYIVADLKTMDRGATEVDLAADAGAAAVIALGIAPIEALNAFVARCAERNIDAVIDMMNVEYPPTVLQQLRQLPQVVLLHRGVDEEHDNKEKMLPLYNIRRIKSQFDVLIGVAGCDTIREVQSVMFNDADIAVVWKSFYQSNAETAELAQEFLRQIK